MIKIAELTNCCAMSEFELIWFVDNLTFLVSHLAIASLIIIIIYTPVLIESNASIGIYNQIFSEFGERKHLDAYASIHNSYLKSSPIPGLKLDSFGKNCWDRNTTIVMIEGTPQPNAKYNRNFDRGLFVASWALLKVE